MRIFFKIYWPSLLLAMLFLLGYPIIGFALIIAGDSCCGEDTSASIRLAARIMATGVFGASFGANLLAYRLQKKKGQNIWLATVITALPSALLYLSAAEEIIEKAFGS